MNKRLKSTKGKLPCVNSPPTEKSWMNIVKGSRRLISHPIVINVTTFRHHYNYNFRTMAGNKTTFFESHYKALGVNYCTNKIVVQWNLLLKGPR